MSWRSRICRRNKNVVELRNEGHLWYTVNTSSMLSIDAVIRDMKYQDWGLEETIAAFLIRMMPNKKVRKQLSDRLNRLALESLKDAI